MSDEGPDEAQFAPTRSILPSPSPSRPSVQGSASANALFIAGDITLGTSLRGDLWEWVRAGCVVYPAQALNLHGIVLGLSGAGKSETLLRIAYLAAKVYNYQVFFIDAKGDWNLADRFRLLMQPAGLLMIGLGCSPTPRITAGWGMDRMYSTSSSLPSSSANPSIKEVALSLLDLAIKTPGKSGSPTTSKELLERLAPDALQRAYKGMRGERLIKGLDSDRLWGAWLRYAAFFSAVNGKLDGVRGFGSWDVGYFLLDGVRLQDEAGRLGRFLINDFEQFLAIRRSSSNRSRRTIIIIDDYSAIVEAATAIGLFERIRGLHGCVLISAQSEEGLGLQSRRIMGTAPTIFLHASVLPRDTVEAARTIFLPQFTYHLPADERGRVKAEAVDEPTFSLTMRRDFRVQPSDVQQLPTGRVYVIHGGLAQLTDVAMLPYDNKEVETLAEHLQREYLQSQQQPIPGTTSSQQKKPGPTSQGQKKSGISSATSSTGALPKLDDLTK